MAADRGQLAPDRGLELAPVRQPREVVGMGFPAVLESVIERRRQVIADGGDEGDLGLVEDPLAAAPDGQQADLAVAFPERHQAGRPVGGYERGVQLDAELYGGVRADGLPGVV